MTLDHDSSVLPNLGGDAHAVCALAAEDAEQRGGADHWRHKMVERLLASAAATDQRAWTARHDSPVMDVRVSRTNVATMSDRMRGWGWLNAVISTTSHVSCAPP